MGQPKQLLPLGGLPVAAWSLRTLAQCADVNDIVIACEPDDRDAFQRVANEHGGGKVRAIVNGGARRQDSVAAALRSFPSQPDVVVVHDGARPFADCGLVSEVVQRATQHRAAIAAVPVKDTIKEVGPQAIVVRTIPRDRLWAAQTPQAFLEAVLSDAHRQAEAAGFVGTDDAELVERFCGVMPFVVEGSYENIKITTPEDLIVAEQMLAGRAPAERV